MRRNVRVKVKMKYWNILRLKCRAFPKVKPCLLLYDKSFLIIMDSILGGPIKEMH